MTYLEKETELVSVSIGFKVRKEAVKIGFKVRKEGKELDDTKDELDISKRQDADEILLFQ